MLCIFLSHIQPLDIYLVCLNKRKKRLQCITYCVISSIDNTCTCCSKCSHLANRFEFQCEAKQVISHEMEIRSQNITLLQARLKTNINHNFHPLQSKLLAPYCNGRTLKILHIWLITITKDRNSYFKVDFQYICFTQ